MIMTTGGYGRSLGFCPWESSDGGGGGGQTGLLVGPTVEVGGRFIVVTEVIVGIGFGVSFSVYGDYD